MRILCLFALVMAAAIVAAPRAASAGPTANPNYTPHPPKPGYSYPDCYCTDSKGKRVEMGQTACLIVGTRRVTARCDMSVNVPIWRDQTEGCPGV